MELSELPENQVEPAKEEGEQAPEKQTPEVPSHLLRETRREAAAFAKDHFERQRTKHDKTFKNQIELTEFQLADIAIEAKHEAEAKFGVKIAVTIDVQGHWWFT